MIFTTIPFLIFLIVVLGIYWSFPSDRWRQPFLLVANFFFYGWWNWKFTSLLFSAILISYVGAILVRKYSVNPLIESAKDSTHYQGESSSFNQRINQPPTSHLLPLTTVRPVGRIVMIGACTLLLGLLGYFKYTNFFLESLRGMIEHLGGHVGWSTLKILLPAGISFYIFQAISYVVSVYRGKLPAENSLVRLGVYLSFFPHLVAGPIIHAPTFLPQLVRKRFFDSAQFVEGCRKFALGFLYKAVFADNLAAPVDVIFKTLKDQSPLTIFGGCLGFYGQIYFDFAGYSLMAIGVANLLGYTLPDNFNFPYRATSLIEFWRRWHISLSTWLRDYVYIPLGGNRCSHSRQYLNIIITMFLGGLWHGASWNFLLWGGVHGLALCLNHFWQRVRGLEKFSSRPRFPFSTATAASPTSHLSPPTSIRPVGQIVMWVLTQGTIFLCWIPFRAATLHDTILIFQKLGTLGAMTLAQLVQAGSFPWLLASLPLLFDMAFNGSEPLRARWSFHSTLVLYGVIVGALLIGLLFMHSGTVNFIYFQF